MSDFADKFVRRYENCRRVCNAREVHSARSNERGLPRLASNHPRSTNNQQRKAPPFSDFSPFHGTRNFTPANCCVSPHFTILQGAELCRRPAVDYLISTCPKQGGVRCIMAYSVTLSQATRGGRRRENFLDNKACNVIGGRKSDTCVEANCEQPLRLLNWHFC